jgi:hypothetical protein
MSTEPAHEPIDLRPYQSPGALLVQRVPPTTYLYRWLPRTENDVSEKRTYNRDQPVALDDRDPSNSDIETLLQPLEPDDNVFTLVNPQQGDLREIAPVAETGGH